MHLFDYKPQQKTPNPIRFEALKEDGGSSKCPAWIMLGFESVDARASCHVDCEAASMRGVQVVLWQEVRGKFR